MVWLRAIITSEPGLLAQMRNAVAKDTEFSCRAWSPLTNLAQTLCRVNSLNYQEVKNDRIDYQPSL